MLISGSRPWASTAPAWGAPRRYGGSGRNGAQCIGRSRGGWNTKLHRVAADARTAVAFALSPGNAHDAPQGRRLLKRPEKPSHRPAPVMGRAGPVRTMKPASWPPILASSPWCLRRAAVLLPGNTTGNGTNGATGSNACSGGSRASAGCSRASTGPTSCSPDSSSSR